MELSDSVVFGVSEEASSIKCLAGPGDISFKKCPGFKTIFSMEIAIFSILTRGELWDTWQKFHETRHFK
jgi:hypothetical protein